MGVYSEGHDKCQDLGKRATTSSYAGQDEYDTA